MKIYPEKIRVKHYQYRTPDQIRKRFENRLKAYRESGKFGHELRDNWMEQILKKGGGEVHHIIDGIKLENKVFPHEMLNDDINGNRLDPNPNLPEYKVTQSMRRYIKNILTDIYSRFIQ